MQFNHLLLMLLVVCVWGLNFIFVSLSLHDMPPLLLCAIRFMLVSIPGVFFIKLPPVPFRMTLLYGLVMFALQFSLLFIAMYVGMTPGMGSVVMQTQVFFSILFAVLFLGETQHIFQVLGALVAFLGIAFIGAHVDQEISLLGLALMLSAAATWGVGTCIVRKMPPITNMSLIVWGCFVSIFPVLGLSFLFEGSERILYSCAHLTTVGIISTLYTAYVSTWVGYGVWNWLLSRYPVGMIAPFALLIPVVGLVSAILVLNEPFYGWKLGAGLLVISGLCVSQLRSHYFKVFYRKSEPQVQE